MITNADKAVVNKVMVNIKTTPSPQLRETFAKALTNNPLATSALALGQLSETPSTAFFFAYQLAVRHLDTTLTGQQFAAFAASESDIRDSREFQTRVVSNASSTGESFLVTGRKSHVMLMDHGLLDFLYVLANDAEQQLKCVKVSTSAAGVTEQPAAKPQPFVADVPHAPVVFDDALAVTDFIVADAHRRCFKPFRYWEDVMIMLAFSGWMMTHANGDCSALQTQAQHLSDCYQQHPDYYPLMAFDILDNLLHHLQQAGKQLPSDQQALWLRDSQLLQLGSVACTAARKKLQRL